MIQTVRAGGVAAAIVAACAFGMLGSPLQAEDKAAAPLSAHYLDHALAGIETTDLGLDTAQAAQPAAAAAAPGEAAAAQRVAARLTRIADAAVPRPRALEELVPAYARAEVSDVQEECLASAVYFEARGEPIDGQLAVADVVLNRVASSRYPDTICDVVEQPWQFSFVNATGRIPEANRNSQSWHKAVAIARVALANTARNVSEDVLWYHADYVSPSWGKRLARQKKVGLHIFYS